MFRDPYRIGAAVPPAALRFVLPLLLVLLGPGLAGPARACGPDTDCTVGARTYRIRLPPGPLPAGTRVGAILLAHGWRERAATIMDNAELGRAVAALGLALIAPQSVGAAWSLPGTPGGSDPAIDEAADMARLVDDVTERFPIDRDRILASGMSAGGMLVWNLACRRADLFAGFAPLSGTYWDPVPATCPSGPATILHTHGRADETVPLTGRRIGFARQGNVLVAIGRYAALGHFGPASAFQTGDVACERQRNQDGQVLELCLHPGGHELRAVDVVRSWRELAAIKGW